MELPQPRAAAVLGVERIGVALEPWAFERIYGAWWDRVLPGQAKDAVRRSVDRYLRALRELPL